MQATTAEIGENASVLSLLRHSDGSSNDVGPTYRDLVAFSDSSSSSGTSEPKSFEDLGAFFASTSAKVAEADTMSCSTVGYPGSAQATVTTRIRC
jgi:hypothetical protein